MVVKKITFEENKNITYTSFTLLVLALMVFAVSEGGVFNRKVEVEAGMSNFSGSSRVFCWDYFGRKKASFDNVLVAPPYLNTDKQSFLDFYTTNPNEVYFDVDNDGDTTKHSALVFDLGPDFDRNALTEVERSLVMGVSASSIAYGKKDPAPTYLAYYTYAILKNEAKVDEVVVKMKDKKNLAIKKRDGEALKKINSLLDILYGEKTRLKQFTDSKAKYPRQVCQAQNVNLPDKYVPVDEQAQKQLDFAISAGQNSGNTGTGNTGAGTTGGTGTGGTTGITGTGTTGAGGTGGNSDPYASVYNGTYNTGGTTTGSGTGTGTTGSTGTGTGGSTGNTGTTGSGTGTGGTTTTGGTGTGTTGTGSTGNTGGGTGMGGYTAPGSAAPSGSAGPSGFTMPMGTGL